MRALTPSITLSDGSVLSLQEKFQGGTGVNMTPPPPSIMQESVVCSVKERIEVCMAWAVQEENGAAGLGFAIMAFFCKYICLRACIENAVFMRPSGGLESARAARICADRLFCACRHWRGIAATRIPNPRD